MQWIGPSEFALNGVVWKVLYFHSFRLVYSHKTSKKTNNMHQTQTCIFRSIHNYHFIVDTSINDIISLWFITWSSWDFHILIVEHHIRSFMTSCHRARKWCLPGKPVVSNMKLSCQENILNVFEQTITKSFLHSFFQFCWCFKCSMVVFNSFQTRKKNKKNRRLFRGAKRSSCLKIILKPSQWHLRNQVQSRHSKSILRVATKSSNLLINESWGNSTSIPCFLHTPKKDSMGDEMVPS